MSHSDQDIPTLTDFIRIGDEDMHHHFDTHQFSLDQDEDWSPVTPATSSEDTFSADAFNHVSLADDQADGQADHSQQLENESEPTDAGDSKPDDFDPLHISAMEIDQIPAELAPFDPALVENDISTDESDEYLELDVQEVIPADTPAAPLNRADIEQTPVATAEAIREQIDQAVDELLPDIARQLKQNLYRHFQCQNDAD